MVSSSIFVADCDSFYLAVWLLIAVNRSFRYRDCRDTIGML